MSSHRRWRGDASAGAGVPAVEVETVAEGRGACRAPVRPSSPGRVSGGEPLGVLCTQQLPASSEPLVPGDPQGPALRVPALEKCPQAPARPSERGGAGGCRAQRQRLERAPARWRGRTRGCPAALGRRVMEGTLYEEPGRHGRPDLTPCHVWRRGRLCALTLHSSSQAHGSAASRHDTESPHPPVSRSDSCTHVQPKGTRVLWLPLRLGAGPWCPARQGCVGTEDLKVCQSENEMPPKCQRPFRGSSVSAATAPREPPWSRSLRHVTLRKGVWTRQVPSGGASGGDGCCNRSGRPERRTRYNLASELNGPGKQASRRRTELSLEECSHTAQDKE